MGLWRQFPNRVGLPGRPAPPHYTEPMMQTPIRARKLRYLALRSAAQPTMLGVRGLDRIIHLKYSLQFLAWLSPPDSLW